MFIFQSISKTNHIFMKEVMKRGIPGTWISRFRVPGIPEYGFVGAQC